MGASLQMTLAVMEPDEREQVLATFTDEELAVIASWGGEARPEQLAPEGGWSYWALIGGRGSGKTRAAAEWVCDRIEGIDSRTRARVEFRSTHVGFIGRTAGDVRSVMLEGESGFIAAAERRGMQVLFNPSRAQLTVTCPDGHECIVRLYSADEPDSLRGPQFDTLWGDEFAAWSRKVDAVGNTALTNAQAGLRLSDHPRGCFTSTPRPTAEVKAIFADETGDWVRTRMTTWDNAANLAGSFISTLERQHGGTRLAAQEFEGLLVEEVEGALWSRAGLDQFRVKPWDGDTVPVLAHRAVAVDPSVAFKGQGDECGIVAGGVGVDRRFYVTGDYSMSADPDDWAREVVRVFYLTGAQVVIAEGNQGYALVASVIHNIDPTVPVDIVHASDGKRARAEPVAQLWDAIEGAVARASIVGSLPGLEDQLTGWSRYDDESPDRLDALAWLGHWAMKRMFYLPTAFSSRSAGRSVGQSLERGTPRVPLGQPATGRPGRAQRLANARARAARRRQHMRREG